MNTKSTITTAARRIAREAGQRHPSMLLHFDGSNGDLVAAHPADQSYLQPPKWPDLHITILGGKTTYRRVQDLLDATEHVRGLEDPSAPDPENLRDLAPHLRVTMYLQHLDTARWRENR